MPLPGCGRPSTTSTPTTSIPKAAARRPATDPIAPQPMIPKRSSDRRRSGFATRYSHCPARTDADSSGSPRSSVNASATAWSATSSVP